MLGAAHQAARRLWRSADGWRRQRLGRWWISGCRLADLWLPVRRGRRLTTAANSYKFKVLVLRSCTALCMFYGVQLWQPAGDSANTTAVQTRAAKPSVACGIHMDDPHAHLFQDRSAHQHVMLTALTSRPAFASWLLYMLQLSHMQDVPVAQRHVNISFVTTYAWMPRDHRRNSTGMYVRMNVW